MNKKKKKSAESDQFSDENSPAIQLLGAQLLALMVSRLFPASKLVGAVTYSLGFYYDFIIDNQFVDKEILEIINVRLNQFIKEDHPIECISMMRENAASLFEHHHQFILALKTLEESSNIVDLIKVDDFHALNPPTDIASTAEIGVVKALTLDKTESVIVNEGKRKKVVRIYGVVRRDSHEMKQFTKKLDLYWKKRDHRKLGIAFNLYSWPIDDSEIGVVWHPKGMELRRLLLRLTNEFSPDHYPEISTSLVEIKNNSNKTAKSIDSFLYEGKPFQLRSAMTRQHLHFLEKFGSGPFEERGIREVGSVYRSYLKSELWGLFCQVSKTVEQSTFYVLKSQLISRLISSLHFIEQIIKIFDFEAQWYFVISSRGKRGSKSERQAIADFRSAFQNFSSYYRLNPEEEIKENCVTEGVCLELRVKDSLGRMWPVSALEIVTSCRGLICLARRAWDSLDCLIALLVEHYEGKFPSWLAPEQIRIFSLGKDNEAYAREVKDTLLKRGYRASLDVREDYLRNRIQSAEAEKIPYILLIGEQERIKQKVGVRSSTNRIESVDLEKFINGIYQESLFPSPM